VVAGIFSGSAIIEGGVRYAETAIIEADCTGRFLVVEAGALVNGQFARIDVED
jgi:phage tail sheath protein FI